MSRALRLPTVLSILLLAARIAPPSALSDPTGAALPPGLYLHPPALYLGLAPLFTLWDGISMLSISRMLGLLYGLALLYLLWRVSLGVRRQKVTPVREGGVLVITLAVFATFVAVGLLWHRPMLSLAGVPLDAVVVDLHSHTNVSHDVRRTLMSRYDVRANRRWHRRAGFDAGFVTDHNTVEGLRREPDVTGQCPGTEVSAWKAHIVLLGNSTAVDRDRYSESPAGLLLLLRTSDSAYGALSIASLPEYERNHWNRLGDFVDAGVDGFEVVNASPTANELSRVRRDSVIALARASNLLIVGASDHHGWGATSMVWNLVRLPGRPVPPAGLCSAILHRLHAGFTAVQVVERHRLRPDSRWPLLATPLGVIWESWRGMGWPLTCAWLVWVWLGGSFVRRLSRKAARS